MGFESFTRRGLIARGRWAFLVAALVAVAAVVISVLGRDSSGSSGNAWQVERRAAAMERAEEAKPASLAGLPAVEAVQAAERLALRVEAEPEEDLDLGDVPVESGLTVRVRARPMLSGGGSPESVWAVHAYEEWVGLTEERSHGRLRPDARGYVAFDVRLESVDGVAGDVFFRTGVDRHLIASQPPVLFGLQTDQEGRVAVPALRRTGAELVIDLGIVVLSPPRHLGTLRFVAARAETYDVALRFMDLTSDSDLDSEPESGGKGRSPWGTRLVRKTIEAADVELRFSTFGELRKWKVEVTGPEGTTPFRHSGQPGDVVDVVFAPPTGAGGVVDLVLHPTAARVIVLAGSEKSGAATLDRDEYREREGRAERIITLPLPGRRRGKREYPLGHIALDDGRYRVELWSLRTADGSRERLSQSTFLVTGGVTVLRL